VIVDRSYRELARVRTGSGCNVDLHEFKLTPDGTALFTCYREVLTADLSVIGRPHRAHVMQSIIQELDLRSGRVLLEWRSLEHIPVTESHHPLQYPYDYLHADSIDITPDGGVGRCPSPRRTGDDLGAGRRVRAGRCGGWSRARARSRAIGAR
jgi:hypothetical protein